MYDNNIKMLANAVVIRACMDYADDVSCRDSVERFLYSEWFQLLTRGCCDPGALVKHLREVVNNGKTFYRTEIIF